jgi:hypothetical protein
MDARSPAQTYALVFGVVLVAAGIIGFFYDASFATPAVGETPPHVFGILDVNGWHNVVHVLTGAIGLAVVGSYSGARTYALVFGVIYVLVAIWGFASPPVILGLLPVNLADNILHLLIGIAGLWAYSATSSAPAPTTTA